MVSQIAPAATTDRSTPIDLGEAPTQPPRRPRRTGTYVLRGIAIGYVGVLVLVPLGVVLWRTIQQGLGTFWDTVSDPTVVHAIVLTGVVAGIAVLLNVVFGIEHGPAKRPSGAPTTAANNPLPLGSTS